MTFVFLLHLISMFGCPYNFHPEKPWLRRTIRGMIAAGIVVTSPLIAVGAVTAAAVALPPVGIYKLVKHIRSRRHAHRASEYLNSQHILFNQENDQQHPFFEFTLHGGEFDPEDVVRLIRERLERLNINLNNEEHADEAFPLAIFADMDVENLFSDDDKPQLSFSTCPTTPAMNIRKGHSRSLTNITTNNNLTINRSRSIVLEH